MPAEGRGLSSRQTQYVVKDLGDWATYKLQDGFRIRRWRRTPKQRREVLSEPDAGNLHVRFDERDVETEPPSNR